MHAWRDKWEYWDELHEAHKYIENYVFKYSRCTLVSKEKWGTLRYSYVLPPGSTAWHLSIKAPWKVKRQKLDGAYEFYPDLFCWPTSWLYYKWQSFGYKILKRAVKKACKKFPNVIKEITADIYIYE